MPVLNNLTKMVAKPIPRMITPKAHAVIDYASVGVFLGSTALFWRRNRRAALASLLCGGAELGLMLLTDYPGGMKKILSFETHRELDYGLAALTASVPETMAFKHTGETKFFRAQGALLTLLGELTQPSSIRSKRGRARAA